jgi:hypothetical protein
LQLAAHTSAKPQTQDTSDPMEVTQCSQIHTQRRITEWAQHRPFHQGVKFSDTKDPAEGKPTHPSNVFIDHMTPYGTPITEIDHTKILCICMVNTQYSFQLYGNNIDLHNAIANLKTLGVQMFVPISLNINWCNRSKWLQTKKPFHPLSPHYYLSAIASDIGKDKSYFSTSVVGGAAILNCGLWSSNVCASETDDSGYGTYTITIIQGKLNKKYSSLLHTLQCKRVLI